MLGQSGITFRQLRDELNKLNDEQLDSHLAVELTLSEEGFSSSAGDVTFDIADVGHELFDNNHPLIVVKY